MPSQRSMLARSSTGGRRSTSSSSSISTWGWRRGSWRRAWSCAGALWSRSAGPSRTVCTSPQPGGGAVALAPWR